MPGALLACGAGMGVQHGVGSPPPCCQVHGCLRSHIPQLARSIPFDVGAVTRVQQPGRARSAFPFIVTLMEPMKPRASAGCGGRAPARRAACTLPLSARTRGAASDCRPLPPSLGDVTSVTEAVAWPRQGGSWSWPGATR